MCAAKCIIKEKLKWGAQSLTWRALSGTAEMEFVASFF